MGARTETWPVPYISRLEGSGIQPGQSVIVNGSATGDRFVINLASGPHESDNIAFHMSCRQNENAFVLNSLEGGSWGKEEIKKNPFNVGDEFDIRIRAHENHYEVFVNQKELCKYEFRQPLTSVNHLQITGDLNLYSVKWGGAYYPVPYEARIDGGFSAGRRLYVSGVPGTNRFSVNLMTSNGDIAIHVNPRFGDNEIVRNSHLGGEWGVEEKEGGLPLQAKKAFDFIIANESYAFQIYINGAHFSAFSHRVDAPNQDPVALRIDGDVELQGVHIK